MMSRQFLRLLRPQITINNFVASPRLCSSHTFKSDIHTDNLYPGSKFNERFAKFDLSKLPNQSDTFNGVIPMKELSFIFSHSSGPGGQNVNKNLTKVDVRFKLDSASWLSDDVKSIVREKYAGQLTKDGYLVIKSDRTRSRQLNQADALQKLRHFIWAAVDEVRTYLETTQIDQVEMEKIRKSQLKATRERIREKRIRSQTKQNRSNMELF